MAAKKGKNDAKKKSDEGGVKYHPTSKRQNNYDGAKPKNKFCPQCGPGVMLAEHKDRVYCGTCHYTQMK